MSDGKLNLEYFAQRLKQERDDLMEERARVLGTKYGDPDPRVLGETGDGMADLSTKVVERQRIDSFNRRMKSLLQAIDRALVKIEEGTYGRCDECGSDINPARLDFMPYAVFCLRCQELHEE